MVDKIVDAINEILGGEDPSQGDQSQTPASKGNDDGDSTRAPRDGQKGRNLDQLVSDAKKQIGDNPQ
ncbi:MAG: hypothetical protein QM589_06860 [Thermomicrobiales bacterium]